MPNGFQFYVGKLQPMLTSFVFNDQLVLPERNEYYYTASPVDKCGKDYILPKIENSLDTSEVHNLQLKPIAVNSVNMSVSAVNMHFSWNHLVSSYGKVLTEKINF